MIAAPLSPSPAPASRRVDVVALVAAGFFVVGGVLALALPWVDDEGMLTMAAATAALEAPLDVLLAQKFRPVGTLLNLPAAALGWQAFLVWHVALASLAVLLLGRVAARLGGSGPVAALALAASPSFVLAALTGQSNTDGLLFLNLALWLLVVRQRRFTAGLVLGAMPWVRYELLPFALVLTAWGLFRRADRRLFWGCCAFPAAFLTAGALYHGDPLWWLHHPPTLLTPAPAARDFDHIRPDAGYLAELPVMLLQVTPLWLAPILVRWRDLAALERTAAVGLALSFTAMVALPFLAVLNFEHNPRYAMAFLPLAALLASRVSTAPSRARLALLAVGLTAAAVALAWVARTPPARLAAATLLVPLAVAVVARVRPARAPAALGLLAALGLAALAAGPSQGRLRHALPSPHLPEVVRWLSQDPRAASAAVVYTNDLRLTQALRRDHPELADRVRLLFQYDVLYELWALLDRDGGQLDRVVAALERSVYGHARWPCELVAAAGFEDAAFVLRDDFRLEEVYPRAWLDAITQEVARHGELRLLLGRALPEGAADGAPRLEAPWLRLGCGGAVGQVRVRHRFLQSCAPARGRGTGERPPSPGGA